MKWTDLCLAHPLRLGPGVKSAHTTACMFHKLVCVLVCVDYVLQNSYKCLYVCLMCSLTHMCTRMCARLCSQTCMCAHMCACIYLFVLPNVYVKKGSTTPIYPTTRTLSSLTWVPQSRLAFDHHRRVSWPWAFGPSAITIQYKHRIACCWRLRLPAAIKSLFLLKLKLYPW